MKKIILIILVLATKLGFCQQISLDDYIKKVLEYNKDLKESLQTIDYALSNEKLYKASRLPSLSLSGDALYKIKHPNTSPEVKNFSYLTALTLSETLYSGGSQKAYINLSRAQKERAIIESQMTINEVIYAAKLSFWALFSSENNMELAERYEEITDSLLRSVQLRYSEGYTSLSDLKMTEAQSTNAKLLYEQAREYLRVSQISFNMMFGDDKLTKYTTTEPKRKDLLALIDENFDPENHPSYLAAQFYTQEQTQNVKIANSAYLPSLSVGVRSELGTVAPNITFKPKLWGTAFATLSVPIFHWRSRNYSIAKAKSNLKIAVLSSEKTEDTIKSEYEQAFESLRLSFSRMNLSEMNLKTARESLELQNYSFSEGKSDIIYILQAQLSWLDAYNGYISAVYNYWTAVAKYEYASYN